MFKKIHTMETKGVKFRFRSIYEIKSFPFFVTDSIQANLY